MKNLNLSPYIRLIITSSQAPQGKDRGIIHKNGAGGWPRTFPVLSQNLL